MRLLPTRNLSLLTHAVARRGLRMRAFYQHGQSAMSHIVLAAALSVTAGTVFKGFSTSLNDGYENTAHELAETYADRQGNSEEPGFTPPPENTPPEPPQEDNTPPAPCTSASLPDNLITTPGNQDDFPDWVVFNGQDTQESFISFDGDDCTGAYSIEANLGTIHANPDHGIGIDDQDLDSNKNECLTYEFAGPRDSFDLILQRVSNMEQARVTGSSGGTKLSDSVVTIDTTIHPNGTIWYGMNFGQSFDALEICAIEKTNGQKSQISVGSLYVRGNLTDSSCYWDLPEDQRDPQDYNAGEAPDGYICPLPGEPGYTVLTPQ